MKVASPNSPIVLYVITKATWGGAQRYVWDLIQAAKEAGYAPVLIYGEVGILSERVRAEGISAYHIPGLTREISLLDEFRAFRRLYRIFVTLRPSIVHLNSSKVSGLGALAAYLARVPRIIFTAHAWAFTESRSSFSKLFFLVAHYVTVFLSDKTILVSGALHAHTEKWPFVREKMVVIRHGISPTDLLSRKEARRILIERDPRLADKENDLWVGTIAELHHNKGIDVGIEAWQEKVPENAQWIVIGEGEREAELKAKSEETSPIHFVGFIPDAQTLMNAFDIFFLPSRTEALGYVLLEAGNASLPVIATNVGGIPEIIENEKTGLLVPKEDFKSMNTALSRLLTQGEESKILGENLHARVMNEFSQEKMLAETLALYSED